LPLSLNQQRLWFLEQMHPRSPLYVMTAAFSFAADADAEGLRWSLQQIVRRQESLRTSIVTVDGEAVAVIAPEAQIDLPEQQERGEAGLARAVQRLQTTGFDLGHGPLVRAALVRGVIEREEER